MVGDELKLSTEIKIGDIEFTISEFYDAWSDTEEIQIKRTGAVSYFTASEIVNGELNDQLSFDHALELELEKYLDVYRIALDKYSKLIIFK